MRQHDFGLTQTRLQFSVSPPRRGLSARRRRAASRAGSSGLRSQGDGAGVARQAVEIGAVEAGEGLELCRARPCASKASAYSSSADSAVKQPAPQTEFSFSCAACGALSVPRKNLRLPRWRPAAAPGDAPRA